MDERQQKLLKATIEHYIETADPVGSSFLAKNNEFQVSSATIRNEFAELEKQGYLFQPHTSAGRVPTEKGYQFYVENFLKDAEISKQDKSLIEKAAGKENDFRSSLKSLAKAVAEISGDAVVLGFASQDVYYTGLSNLFSQPEFSDRALMQNMTAIIDHLDEVMFKLFDEIDQVKIMVGENNPFGSGCSIIIKKYQNPQKQNGIIGILGPCRMKYNQNLSIIKFCHELITKLSNHDQR